MPRVWDLIDRDTQDRLIVLMFVLQKKERPDKEPFWITPDREYIDRGWLLEGRVESLEEIDRLMREPDIRRVKPE